MDKKQCFIVGGALTRRVLPAIILLIAACASVHSANIQETNNKLWAFRLEGAISNGDFDRWMP